jgi:hypothetical protein
MPTHPRGGRESTSPTSGHGARRFGTRLDSRAARLEAAMSVRGLFETRHRALVAARVTRRRGLGHTPHPLVAHARARPKTMPRCYESALEQLEDPRW